LKGVALGRVANPAAGRAGGSGAGGDSTGGRGGQAAPPVVRHAVINHISFGVSPWDTDAVAAALTQRGLNARADTGGSLDIHDPNAKYKSYHTTTPGGWDLQISNGTSASRNTR